MGYIAAIGECLVCRRLFQFNPDRVPSHRRTPDGPREPICDICMTAINNRRKANGLEPFPILPGAYDAEAADGTFADDD
jgi:hypothetical protein